MLIAIPCCVLAAVVANRGVRYLQAKGQPTRATVAAATAAWKEQEYGGIRLELPFALGESADIKKRLPEEVALKFSQFQNFIGSRGEELTIMVQHMAMKDEFQPDFEGALKGSLAGAGRSVGDPDPDYTRRPLEVDGLPGARTSYHHTFQGHTLHHEQLMMQRDQEIWCIVVVSTLDGSASDHERIFASVHPLPKN
jgi:hypothetical protein